LEKQQRNRLAHEQNSADHHGSLARQPDTRLLDEIHDPERSAGPESGLAGEQTALAHWMKTVDVLLRRQTVNDALLVEPFRKRELDEDAMHVAIGVQLVDHREQLALR